MTELKSVELSAQEPAQIERRGFPLTVGVPFAPGVLGVDDPVGIEDELGNALALQTHVLEKHDDGSVRWLLLDYQADFEPLSVSRQTLRLGSNGAAAPPQCIETKSGGDTLTIDNGVLTLKVDTARCRPLMRVSRGGEVVSDGGLEFTITNDEDNKYSAHHDADAEFEIEYDGPLRLAMRWRGLHKSEKGKGHFDFDVRMTVYAGQPYVRVDHVFVNKLDDLETRVKQIVAHLPISVGGKPSYAASTLLRSHQQADSSEPIRLSMYKLTGHQITTQSGDVITESGQHAFMGWADVSGEARGVMLAGKNFWQNYPKAIAVAADGIDCHLIPDCGEDSHHFPVPRGMAKTHTFFVHFHLGRQEQTPRYNMAVALQRWPMPAASSEYYPTSGEIWDFIPYFPKKYPRLEIALRQFFRPDHPIWPVLKDPPNTRAYGLKHYGDFVSPTDDQDFSEHGPDPDSAGTYYLNNEYDAPHVLTMLFLRAHEIVKWWGAEAHALHMMDVDMNHYPKAHPSTDRLHDGACMINCQYRHCFQHVGGIQTVGETRHTPAEGSHSFAEGMFDLYHFTGDRRALEVGMNLARHLAYMTNESGYRWTMSRQAGWALTVLAAAYRACPEPEIKKAADIQIDKTIDEQHDLHDRHINLYLRGVVSWHLATGDEVARKMILNLTDIFIRRFQVDEGIFFISDWPEEAQPTSPMQGFANLEVMAYCYDLTGDRRYIDAGLAQLYMAVQWILEAPRDNPKEGRALWERALRGPLRFMAIAHELGILENVPGIGRWIEQ